MTIKLKPEWLPFLHRFRRRELEMVFGRCPEKLFATGLELGAGDGFQSRLLSRYVSHLLSTDYDSRVLANPPSPSITYRVCDAEKVDRVLAGRRFDLIFSSNLLEHLPDPDTALRGFHEALTNEGIMIHVLPSPFWKATHLLLYVPNRIMLILERLLQPGAMTAVARKLGLSSARPPATTARDNNPKITRSRRLPWLRFLYPEPHGVSPGNLREFADFARSRWIRRFHAAGFDLLAVKKGPVASGYGFGLESFRRILERMGFASEFIYVATRRGASSPFSRYFPEAGAVFAPEMIGPLPDVESER